MDGEALTREDYTISFFERRLGLAEHLSFHNISRYFQGGTQQSDLRIAEDEPTEIEYKGDSYSFSFKDDSLKITKSTGENYNLPQVMYIPAERNIASYISDFRRSKTLPESVIELISQTQEAAKELKDGMPLPVNNLTLSYQQNTDSLFLSGKGYGLYLEEASSGVQSLVPLYLISNHFANAVKTSSENGEQMSSEEQLRFKHEVAQIHNNPTLSDSQRKAAISVAAAKYNKTAFINIVEEPEQNLFPSSQWEILKDLLKFNNLSKGNKLIMTTHSPYILMFLTIAVKGLRVFSQVQECKKPELVAEIEEIVPFHSVINSEDLVIYEMNEEGGIKKLGDYKGLPSDENYLNDHLEKSNILYSQLLRIEDQCR